MTHIYYLLVPAKGNYTVSWDNYFALVVRRTIYSISIECIIDYYYEHNLIYNDLSINNP